MSQKPHKTRAVAVAVLIIYAFFSQYGLSFMGQNEVFPLFHWDLFGLVTSPSEVYELELEQTTAHGTQSCLLHQCSATSQIRSKKDLFYLIQDLGHRTRYSDAQPQIQMLEEYLRSYFPNTQRYHLYLIKVDPKEYVTSQSRLSREKLFSKGLP